MQSLQPHEVESWTTFVTEGGLVPEEVKYAKPDIKDEENVHQEQPTMWLKRHKICKTGWGTNPIDHQVVPCGCFACAYESKYNYTVT